MNMCNCRYKIMRSCWNENPTDRPTFTQLRNLLDELIEAHSAVDYMTFNLDESKPYYLVDQVGSSDDADIVEDESDEVFGGERSETSSQTATGSDSKRHYITTAVSHKYGKKTDKKSASAGKTSLDHHFHKLTPKLLKAKGFPLGLMALHTPLKVTRKSADDLLSMSFFVTMLIVVPLTKLIGLFEIERKKIFRVQYYI